MKLASELITHIDAFRNALYIAKSCDTRDDSESYWQHEIRALHSIEQIAKQEATGPRPPPCRS
jgi:hypothetical protein